MGMQVWVKMEDTLRVVPVLIFLLCMFLNMLFNFETVLMDGKMNNIIILHHQEACAFLQSIKEFKLATTFCPKSEKLVFKQDDFFL